MREAMEVLLVEDDPGDVLMTTEAFAESRRDCRIVVVGDGVEALAYLRREGDYTDAVTPDVVLLDLNLPRMGGREVLAAMKADDELRDLPVVVLSTSKAADDVLASYGLRADAYVTKPADFDDYVDVVRQIDDAFGRPVRQTTS